MMVLRLAGKMAYSVVASLVGLRVGYLDLKMAVRTVEQMAYSMVYLKVEKKEDTMVDCLDQKRVESWVVSLDYHLVVCWVG